MLKLLLLTALVASCYAIEIRPVFPIRALSVINGMIVNPAAAAAQQQFARQQVTGFDETNPGITFISGHVSFVQTGVNEPVSVEVDIEFVPPVPGKAARGLHVHTLGLIVQSDNVTQVCDSTGPHYNPDKTTHGSLTSRVRHPGDFGNVDTIDGKIRTRFAVPGLNLFGDESIIGRSVVLHEKMDDDGLGASPTSKLNGNSGPRIACGDIIYDKTN